jgi:hypothetical protein
MPLELVPLCTVDAVLRDPIDVGAGPSGWRLVFEVAEATVSGERLSGTMAGMAGADWVSVGGGVGVIDVRMTVRTDDGAVVLVTYNGRTDATAGPGAPIYVAPTFQTGDERYAWLNAVQAVGRGDLDGNALHYEWFEVR